MTAEKPGQWSQAKYTEVTALRIPGAMVGLLSCKRCGCLLMMDPRDGVDVLALHDEWHGRQEQRCCAGAERVPVVVRPVVSVGDTEELTEDEARRLIETGRK